MGFFIEQERWYDTDITIRPTRVVQKRRWKGEYLGSCIVPSMLYPLDKPSAFEVFTYRNTDMVSDPDLRDLIDQQIYDIGRCYTNTKRITKALQKAGYTAKSYVGWMFSEPHSCPIHHCWTVVEGKHLIDLADDFTVFLTGENGQIFKQAKTGDERREAMASFQLAAREVLHSQRCFPLGVPAPFLMYVGCECDPECGKEIYRKLIRDNPDHECQYHANGQKFGRAQKIFKEHGLMDWAKNV